MSDSSDSNSELEYERRSMKGELTARFMQWKIEEPMEELPVEQLDTEFKREFPPDTFGQEASENARVWKVYRHHATAHDEALVDGWNSTLDILLIFAGLFSAVATAFLIESYQTLQFDKDGFVVNALYALVVLQNSTGHAPSLPTPPSVTLSPSASTRWTNVLWFTSLLLALAVSLLCILVKQWAREYRARNNASSKSPREWAHRRAFLFSALQTWRLGDFISVLPSLLHASLFLFLAGSALFLWDLDRAIASVAVFLGSLLGGFYVMSICIPLWRLECPTSTPLVQFIRRLWTSAHIALIRMRIPLADFTASFRFKWEATLQRLRASTLPSRGVHHGLAHHSGLAYPIRLGHSTLPFERRMDSASRSLERRLSDEHLIRDILQTSNDLLDGRALLWILADVSDSDAVAVAFQAISALRPSSHAVRFLKGKLDIQPWKADAMVTQSLGKPNMLEAARVAKTFHVISDGGLFAWFGWGKTGVCSVLSPRTFSTSAATYPDFALLAHYTTTVPHLSQSPTATSTIMAVLNEAQDFHLLEHCDFRSSAMDWDHVLLVAANEVPSNKWADVPEDPGAEVEAQAARACVALAGLLAKLIREGSDRPSWWERTCAALPNIIARLMSIASPQMGGPVSPYGTELSDLVEFIDSPSFWSIDSRLIPRCFPVDLGLIVLYSATALYTSQRRNDECRRVVTLAMSLLRENKLRGLHSFGDFVYGFTRTISENMDVSPRTELLPLFLLDQGSPPRTTIYQMVWQYPRDPSLVYIIRDIISWLAEIRGHPLQTTIEDAFFVDMRFTDVLSAGCAYPAYGFYCYLTLVEISLAYRNLRPAMWKEDIDQAAAASSASTRVRAVALEIQKMSAEGRTYISESDVANRMTELCATERDEDSRWDRLTPRETGLDA